MCLHTLSCWWTAAKSFEYHVQLKSRFYTHQNQLLSVVFKSASHYLLAVVANERERESGGGVFLQLSFTSKNVTVARGQRGHAGGSGGPRAYICVWKSRPSHKRTRRTCEADTRRKQKDIRPWLEYARDGSVVTTRFNPEILGVDRLALGNQAGDREVAYLSDERWNSFGERGETVVGLPSLWPFVRPILPVPPNHAFLYLGFHLPSLPSISASNSCPSLSNAFYHSQQLPLAFVTPCHTLFQR